MDEFLTMFAEKYIDAGVEKIIVEKLYLKRKILVEKMKVFCRLVEKGRRRYSKKEEEYEETGLQQKPYFYSRNIDDLVLKVKQWTIALQKERLDFLRFRENVEIDWKTVKLRKKNIEESLAERLAIRVAEYSSKVSSRNMEAEMRKKSVEMDRKSLEDDLKRISSIRYSRRYAIYNACNKAKKICFGQVEKYDNDIEVLYTCKSTLSIDKDITEKEYLIVQDQLIVQRAFYNQLKKECELNVEESFLSGENYSTKLEIVPRTRVLEEKKRQEV